MSSEETRSPSSNPQVDSDYVLADFADGDPRRGKLGGRLIILLVVGLVLGPMLYYGVPQELAKWRIAAAEEQWLDGDLSSAIGSLDDALRQFPENSALLLRRAEFHLENEAYEECIEDCHRVLELEPDSPQAYFHRSQAYGHLGRHEEAIADCQELVRLGEEGRWPRVAALNGLAYGRAVGKTDLEEGLAEVEEAIRLGGDDPAMLDTRGYLHYLLGNLEQAREDMDRAVRGIELAVAALPKAVQFPDPRVSQVDRRRYEESVAVIRYHRALVYDALEQTELAEADRRRVRQLGYEPNEDLF